MKSSLRVTDDRVAVSFDIECRTTELVAWTAERELGLALTLCNFETTRRMSAPPYSHEFPAAPGPVRITITERPLDD